MINLASRRSAHILLRSVPMQLPFIGWIGPLRPLQKVLQTLTIPTASALFKRTGRQFFLADGSLTSSAHQIPAPGWTTSPSPFDSLPTLPLAALSSPQPAAATRSSEPQAGTSDLTPNSADLTTQAGGSNNSGSASGLHEMLPDAAVWLALVVPSLAGAMNRMAGLATLASLGSGSKDDNGGGSSASDGLSGGEQSVLVPASQPLLVQMTLDCPEQGQYFYSALKSFASRTCYANTGAFRKFIFLQVTGVSPQKVCVGYTKWVVHHKRVTIGQNRFILCSCGMTDKMH